MIKRQELEYSKIPVKLHKLVLPKYQRLIFKRIDSLKARVAFTKCHYRHRPLDLEFAPVNKKFMWGQSGLTAWFIGKAVLPSKIQGQKVYLQAETGGVETLIYIDDVPIGVFDENHHTIMLFDGSIENRVDFEFSLEAYAGHSRPGCHISPLDKPVCIAKDSCCFEGIWLAVKQEIVEKFVFDLSALLQLEESLDADSFLRNRILEVLLKVYKEIDAIPEEKPEHQVLKKLGLVCKLMQPVLQNKNTENCPKVALTGHSHLDTAWLWTIDETKRKCARTFSMALNLMREYPEYRFIQSAAYHAEIVKKEYPAVYRKIKEMVQQGRWEPNGGMYVEADCNIPSGEALIRNFLFGIQFVKNNFNYCPDTLWLPDVFGYSASLPQILKGCNIDYFCTTKLSWNDTTKFPYSSFVWRGIDGSGITSHFNTTHIFPDIKNIKKQWKDCAGQTSIESYLCAYGYGDGGGGPHYEMIESVRRIADIEGCPRTEHMSVSDFMKKLEKMNLPEWFGELYLELHRGAYTSLSKLKWYNRKLEFALRDAEILSSMTLLSGGEYQSQLLKECWKKLLINQFHDIIPGTSIEPVNVKAEQVYADTLSKVEELKEKIVSSMLSEDTKFVTLINTLSWPRSERLFVELGQNIQIEGEGVVVQQFENLQGKSLSQIYGVSIPAMGAVSLNKVKPRCHSESVFKITAQELESPLAKVKFDDNGTIVSLIIKNEERDIVKPGGALNAILIGDDTPIFWDNWDIDADQYLKMKPANNLTNREVVSDGPLQIRIRSYYKIGQNSHMIQDMVFYAHTLQVDFETKVDWREKHCLLKAGFNFNLLIDKAKCETQFGYLERSTHNNRPHEQAQFEVCSHKWVDVSEQNFGVALLNDCKYGLGLNDGSIYLTLLKSGTHPDGRADKGVHYFNYSIFPHSDGFNENNVVIPAYEFNVPVITRTGRLKKKPNIFFGINHKAIVLEAVKQSEDKKGLIARFYESTKARRVVKVTVPENVTEVFEANMLEETKKKVSINNGVVELTFKPFEIKTLACKF